MYQGCALKREKQPIARAREKRVLLKRAARAYVMWPLKRILFLSRPSRSWNVQRACDLKTQLTFHAFAWQCNSPRPIDRQPVNWISFSWLFISLMNSARTRVAITAIDYSDRSLKSTDDFLVYEALTVFRKLISIFFFFFFFFSSLPLRGREVDFGEWTLDNFYVNENSETISWNFFLDLFVELIFFFLARLSYCCIFVA